MKNRRFKINTGGMAFEYENVLLECHSGALHVYEYQGDTFNYDQIPVLIVGLDKLVYAMKLPEKDVDKGTN